MGMTIWKIFFRLLLAVVIGAIASLLFQSVLPAKEAQALGLLIGAVELVGSLFTSQSGAGGGVRIMLRMGEVLLSWPVAAWALMAAGLHDPGIRLGLAAGIASAVGMGAARFGYGKDTARLVAVLVACAIPIYALVSALLSGDAKAMIAACLAAAVAPITASVAHVWPDTHSVRFVSASVLCVAGGMAVFVSSLLMG